MKTVGNFPDLASAQLAQSLVEDEGIRALIPDQYFAGIDWLMSTAIGGVRLQVPPEHAETALARLARPEPIAAGDLAQFGEPRDEDRCPVCASESIAPRPYRRRVKAVTMFSIFLFLLVGPFVLFIPDRLHCSSCGHTW